MRSDTRGLLGWRVNRLSDRPTSVEIVGSACGYALAFLFVVAAAYLLFFARPSAWMVALPIVGALLMGWMSSLSTGQFLYRAWLRRRLAAVGVPTMATVTDRWRLYADGGMWSCIRFSFTTAGGPIERVAADSTKIVARIKIGDALPLLYDADDPRRLLIGPLR